MYSFSSVSRSEMEDFAKVSNFQSFYNSHQTYYKGLLVDAKTKLNVNQIQTWLETQFGSKYDKYNLVISPLMHATHFTRHFTYQGEKLPLCGFLMLKVITLNCKARLKLQVYTPE
jgi:hypothetical protein